ncbi:hypothetical protein V8E55_008699 [Tylopilus felleus]
MRSFVLALIIAALAVFTSAAPVALSEDLDNILVQANVDSVLGSLGDGGSGITRRDGPTSAIVKRGFGAFAASVNARNLLDGLDTELGDGSLTDSKNCTQRDSGGYFSASTILEKLKGISHSPRAVTGGLSTDTDWTSYRVVLCPSTRSRVSLVI